MNNGKQYPFQRNRYYSGKLLTSADFQAEQDYFNNKSRFMNLLMYGSGIVCGMGVVALDDVSVLVESGVAIDGLGREIIQDTSIVRKLSAINGYDNLKSTEISLCIKYDEENMHSVYAINNENSTDFEFSRVQEKSTLFLVDRSDLEEYEELQVNFITGVKLYSDTNFDVLIEIPKTVTKKSSVKMNLKIVKKSDADIKLTLHGVLQVPGFVTEKNNNELYIDAENVYLVEGEEWTKDYWLDVGDTESSETKILLKSDSGRVYIDDELVEIPSGFEITVKVTDMDPREIIKRETGKVNLEDRTIGASGEYIRLADINLVTNMGIAIIESIDETNAKRYIAVPGGNEYKYRYMDYFSKKSRMQLPEAGDSKSVNKGNTREVFNDTNTPEVASGILEIPLGEVARKGDIRYSGEIVHGLGKGNVYVHVGFETIKEDSDGDGKSEKVTVFGNTDLFRNDKGEAPMVDTAVKVLNSKGSFVVAVKLLENVDFLVIKLRWMAIKFQTGKDISINDDYKGKSIVPETPTVVLNIRESHHFGVRFENMDPCSLMYELTEDGSGEITSEGVYTAPAKEGVFEIRIYCAEMPMVCSYAYAIVRRSQGNSGSGSGALDKGNIIDEVSI